MGNGTVLSVSQNYDLLSRGSQVRILLGAPNTSQ